MGFLDWIKNLFGFLGRIFNRDSDNANRTRDERYNYAKAAKLSTKKLGFEREEAMSKASLRKLVGNLSRFFEGKAKDVVASEVRKFEASLKRLDKESIRVEEAELQRVIIEWEKLKVYMQTRDDVADRVTLGVLINAIDNKFIELTSEISKEAATGAKILKYSRAAENDEDLNAGVPPGTSDAEAEGVLSFEARKAKQEEAEVKAGKRGNRAA